MDIASGIGGPWGSDGAIAAGWSSALAAFGGPAAATGAGLACVIVAVASEALVAKGLQALLWRWRPLCGAHADSVVHQRSLWTPGETDLLLAPGLLLLAAAALWTWWALPGWPLWTAALPWMAALAWRLASWQRVGVSVKFIAWRRGWRRSARRAAISDLREVQILQRDLGPALLPSWLQPTTLRLVLVFDDGKAIKLPRTGGWFGARAERKAVQRVADFTRLQMDLVADARRQRAADKRLAARRAMQQPAPMHQSAKLDVLALPGLQ